MLRIRLLHMVCFIPLLAASAMPLCAQVNDQPPRSNPPFAATAGPVPAVYDIGVRLGACDLLDVDEFGRLYMLDGVRQEMFRLSAAGELERSWLDGPHDSIWASTRSGISAGSGGRVYLSPGAGLDNIRVLGPGPNDDALVPLSGDIGAIIQPLEDGSFYCHAEGRCSDTGTCLTNNVAHIGADGSVKSRWEYERTNGLILGPDGLFYGALYESSAILVMDKTGKTVRKVELNIDPTNYRPNFASVFGVDRNGDIYVLFNCAIYRLDPNGHLLARWYAYRTKDDTQNVVRFGSLNSAFGAATIRNGLIYAAVTREVWRAPSEAASPALPNSVEVQVFTVAGQCVARYVTTQQPPGLPMSVAVLSDGSYAVVERSSKRAYAVDTLGKRCMFLEDIESQMLLARGDEFLLSSDGRMSAFDKTGQKKKCLYTGLQSDKHAPNMWQMAFDPNNGDIWGLGWSGIITHLGPDGGVIKEYPENKSLCFPTFCTGMAMDHQGFIYVPYPQKHRIEKVDSDGKVVLSIGKEGSGGGELRFPEGMVMDSQDRLYVADSGNSRIQVFDTSGKSLGVYGRRGSGDGEFDRPYGITIAPDNTIWVADTFNDRIVRIPMAEFWSKIKTELKPEPVAAAPKPEPEPQAGDVTVTGVVIAGSEDFDDVVYVEDANRAWAIEVVLPQGKSVKRGSKCKLVGQLTAPKRSAKRLAASSVSEDVAFALGESAPAALGMAGLYVGDGYRNGDKKTDVCNLAMLVRAWGKVISVDNQAKALVISDGSFSSGGLPVYMDGKRIKPSDWPQVGQYVGVTGVSVRRADSTGKAYCGVRVRDGGDITVLSQ